MYPHRIRLRGPWDYELLAHTGPVSLPPGGRMTLPCRWRDSVLGDFTGRVRFRRRFGLPRRIDAHERLWLTFAGVTGRTELQLNGSLLGRLQNTREPAEFEVTALLQPRNELIVEVEAAGGDGGLWGEVALEVRCTAFLQELRLWSEGTGPTARLHLSGLVVGVAERPLDLYLLLDGATIAYRTVEAIPSGQSFQLVSEEVKPLRGGEHEVRVELVNGASVWYCAELPLDSAVQRAD